jgi:hypothetical protein
VLEIPAQWTAHARTEVWPIASNSHLFLHLPETRLSGPNDPRRTPVIFQQRKILYRRAAPLLLCLVLVLLPHRALIADPIAVRHVEGVEHGFLTLRDMGGKKLADGEMTQVVHGGRVHSRLVFRFYDGSLYDETTEFTQEGNFKLVTDHLVQKGPSFKQPSDVVIDVAKGEVTMRRTDDHGKVKADPQKLDMPADVYNGLLFTLVKDIPPTAVETSFSYVSTSPKPQVVKLVVTREGERPVSSGRIHLNATLYKMKVDIGGVKGVVAKVTGKLPADTRVWVLQGEAPSFVQLEGPLYAEGPVWRIEMASPRASPNPR